MPAATQHRLLGSLTPVWLGASDQLPTLREGVFATLASSLSPSGIAITAPVTAELLASIPSANTPLLVLPQRICASAVARATAWLLEHDRTCALLTVGNFTAEHDNSSAGSPTAERAASRLLDLGLISAGNVPSAVIGQSGGEEMQSVASTLVTIVKIARRCHELESQLAMARRAQERADVLLSNVDHELHTAAAFQRRIAGCPRTEIPGLEVASLYSPYWHVSGDMYAVLPTESGARFALADASGHGVAAAMHAMIVAHELVCAERHAGPAQVLQRLNGRLASVLADEVRFATAMLGELNVQSRTLTLALAGHHPLLLIRRGELIELGETAMILGVFPEAEFGQVDIALQPGDTLLAYTDGLEQPSSLQPAGTPEHQPVGPLDEIHHRILLEAFGNSCPLTECMNKLHEGLGQRAGSLHQHDDLTVLAMRLSA